MNIKLKDVAQEAGVGVGTASRALGGRGPVDERTRQKVIAVAEKLGYRVNATARALREQKTRTVGLIVPDIVNEFYTESAELLQNQLDQSGYQLVVATTGNSSEKEARVIQSMLDRQVDAVVHVPVNPKAEFPPGFLVVELNRRGEGGRPTVCSDDAAGLGALARHLTEQGYRDIGIIAGPRGLSTTEDRLNGFLSALQSAGFSESGAGALRYRIIHTEYSPRGGAEAFGEFLDSLPDVLVPLSSQLTLGVLKKIRAEGISVPEEMGLATYGTSNWLEVWGPGITTFAPDLPTMGAQAAQLALRLLEEDTPGETAIRVPGHLLIRGTTPVRAQNQ